MKQKDTNVFSISIYWENVIILIFLACFFALLYYFDIDARYPSIPCEVLFCVCILEIVLNLAHYDVTSDMLVIYWACISIRRIHLESVRSIVFIPQKKGKHAEAYRSQIVFLLADLDSKGTDITKKEFDSFRRKHPFKSVKAFLPQGSTEKFIQFISEHSEIKLVKQIAE